MADRVIAVINQKGGTGKTTLALNFAAGLARRAPTAVIDADPQRSISQWIAMGGSEGELPVATPIGDNPAATIAALKKSHRYVVVDCPPTVQGAVIDAVMAAISTLAHKSSGEGSTGINTRSAAAITASITGPCTMGGQSTTT